MPVQLRCPNPACGRSFPMAVADDVAAYMARYRARAAYAAGLPASKGTD